MSRNLKDHEKQKLIDQAIKAGFTEEGICNMIRFLYGKETMTFQMMTAMMPFVNPVNSKKFNHF